MNFCPSGQKFMLKKVRALFSNCDYDEGIDIDMSLNIVSGFPKQTGVRQGSLVFCYQAKVLKAERE